MKRKLTYTAERGDHLDIGDLERALADVRKLDAWGHIKPVIDVDPSRPGQKVGRITRITIEDRT